MPYSNNAFDNHIFTIMCRMSPKSICDIGPGAGKYGRLAHQAMKHLGTKIQTTALEIDQQYIEEFKLTSIYDEVIVGDAVNIIKQPRHRFDLVVIGDCIEHMRKSDGIDLLNFLVYRSAYIAVVYPEAFVQDDWQGHAAEAHISVWSMDDFRGFQTLHASKDGMHLFLVKGYQQSEVEFRDVTADSVHFFKRTA